MQHQFSAHLPNSNSKRNIKSDRFFYAAVLHLNGSISLFGRLECFGVLENVNARAAKQQQQKRKQSVKQDTNTCFSVSLEITPSHPPTLTHTHQHSHTPLKKSAMFFHSHHHRYPVEVLQRNLATHKVAKSLPFCVTAGNNTYTCLADSFCRSPLCIRMKRERRGKGGYEGV